MTILQYPWSNTFNNEDQVNPANNYMWIAVKPTPAYVTKPGYFTQIRLTSGTNTFSNNINVYPAVKGGNAVWDCHKILQNLVSYDTGALETIDSRTYIASKNIAAYQFGVYEYSGSHLLGSTPIAGAGSVINAAADRNQIWNMQQYTMGFVPNQGQFLTDWSGSYYVRMNDRANLSYFYDSQLPSGSGNIPTVQEIVLNLYDTNGQNYLTVYSHNTHMTDTATEILNFGCGPVEINNTTWYEYPNSVGPYPSPILSYVGHHTGTLAYYTIGLLLNPNNVEVATKRFNINFECTLINEIQLYWLNKLGSWSFYTFYKEMHQQKVVSRKNYTKDDANWNGSSMTTMPWTRGETVLSVDEQEKWILTSKILDDAMAYNFAGIIDSPEVYMFYQGYCYPMIVEQVDPDNEVLKSRNTQTNPNGRNIYTITMHKSNREITIGQ